MGLLPDTLYDGLRMHRECQDRFPRHRLQRKPVVSDPGMHHGTCVTHVPWCMSGSLICGGGENVPCIPAACATRNFAYLLRGPWGVTCSYPPFTYEDVPLINANVVTMIEFLTWRQTTKRWLSALLQYLQCVINGDTAILHWAIAIVCSHTRYHWSIVASVKFVHSLFVHP